MSEHDLGTAVHAWHFKDVYINNLNLMIALCVMAAMQFVTLCCVVILCLGGR